MQVVSFSRDISGLIYSHLHRFELGIENSEVPKNCTLETPRILSHDTDFDVLAKAKSSDKPIAIPKSSQHADKRLKRKFYMNMNLNKLRD